MSETLNRYKYKLDQGANDWYRWIADPYVIAYDHAFDSYKQTTELQRKADEQRAELFVLAASLVTGSILMATVASSSFRLLARRAAISALGRRNLRTAFSLVKTAQSSEPFMFAVGGLMDEAKSQVKKVAQGAVNNLVTANLNIISNSAMVQSKTIDIAIRNHLACGYSCGLAFEDDRTLSSADRAQGFAFLSRAAICNPPQTRINVDKLSKKIELCMYMNLILDSDRLVTHPMQPADREGRFAAAVMGSSKPIDVSPNADNYPRSTSPRRDGLMNSSYQTVDFNRPGSILRRRIDELCRASLGRNFYSSQGDMGMRELQAAERTLIMLANDTRPLGISDLKS